MERCAWAGTDPENVRYHDEEWGRPVTDDKRLFEKLCLEGFQSGLSWLTILKKRPQFRKQFKNFDPVKVSKMTAEDVDRLLQDAGIIRHRGKIESTINNAKRVLEVQKEFGSLAAYIWKFEPTPAPVPKGANALPAQTAASIALSKDLRKRGFSFVGPTTSYAFMQAMGLVNDHYDHCDCRGPCEAERKKLKRPAKVSQS
jgi:DNA-3-methyladenine glycosylase I